MPRPVAEKADEPLGSPVQPRRDGTLRHREEAEDLERDREVVRGENPDGVHVVRVPPADTSRPDAHDVAQLPAPCDLGQELDARVIAPLVHHVEPVGRHGRELLGVFGVVRQRLLDVNRHSVFERLLRDGRMSAGRSCDDDPVHPGQLSDPGHEARGSSLVRNGLRPVRAGSDRHLAAERDQVAEDQPAPISTPDQADVHQAVFSLGRTRKRYAIAIVVEHTVNATAFGTIRYQFSIAIPYAIQRTKPTRSTQKYATETSRDERCWSILRIWSAGETAITTPQTAAATPSAVSSMVLL